MLRELPGKEWGCFIRIKEMSFRHGMNSLRPLRFRKITLDELGKVIPVSPEKKGKFLTISYG